MAASLYFWFLLPLISNPTNIHRYYFIHDTEDRTHAQIYRFRGNKRRWRFFNETATRLHFIAILAIDRAKIPNEQRVEHTNHQSNQFFNVNNHILNDCYCKMFSKHFVTTFVMIIKVFHVPLFAISVYRILNSHQGSRSWMIGKSQ